MQLADQLNEYVLIEMMQTYRRLKSIQEFDSGPHIEVLSSRLNELCDSEAVNVKVAAEIFRESIMTGSN